MGNYNNLESDFIERTIMLIDQYYKVLNKYPFEEQFNYTLIINCLLGLIVMPKEKVLSFIPTTKLTKDIRNEIGMELTEIGENINNLRELIYGLRHSIAHFDISVISDNDNNHIDWVEFKDTKNNNLIAKFRSTEIRLFLNYYSGCLLHNLGLHRK